MDPSSSSPPGPPLLQTEHHAHLQDSSGSPLKPEIFSRIDKGFFMADNDWTCYRRNYFSLNCSYTLHPAIPTGSIFLMNGVNGSGMLVSGFAMSIAAVVDGRDGKPIELVQHTPKRDKGPQEKPARILLSPQAPAPHNIYGPSSDSHLYGSSGGFGGSTGPGQTPMEATFERIQFKNATANNGKRRAAQQYYHLLVELFVDTGREGGGGGNGGERWVKIASRMSAPMVVRGRSPGHYSSERRGSNASNGNGSAGGSGAYSTGGSSRGDGSLGGGGMGGMGLGSSGHGYGGGYGDARHGGHHYSRSNMVPPLQIPLEDEKNSVDGGEGYMYYTGSAWESPGSASGHDDRYHLPHLQGYTDRKYGGGGSMNGSGGSGFILPSLEGGRHCGRSWEIEGSKGYFPNTLIQTELNMTS